MTRGREGRREGGLDACAWFYVICVCACAFVRVHAAAAAAAAAAAVVAVRVHVYVRVGLRKGRNSSSSSSSSSRSGRPAARKSSDKRESGRERQKFSIRTIRTEPAANA